MKNVNGLTFAFHVVALLSSVCLAAQPHSGGEPDWSPDGEEILYVWGNHLEVQIEGKYLTEREVMIMKADGSHVRKLTSNNYADEYPTLSPDGKTILFSSNRDGDWKLYTMDKDGSNQRDLGLGSTSPVWNDPCRADWSPDGKQFVFPVTKSGERILCIANHDGTGVKAIPNGKGIYPHWSRDGKSITYYNKGNIHSINIDGTNHKQVTNYDPALPIRPNYPQWSADGSSIFFIKGDDIFNINADGTHETRLTNIPGQKWYLGVSIKNRLVYTCNQEELEVIHVLEIDGSGDTLITK